MYCLTTIVFQSSKLRADIESAKSVKVAEEANLDEIMQGLNGATNVLRGELEEVQGRLVGAERKVAVLQTEREGVETELQLARSRYSL